MTINTWLTFGSFVAAACSVITAIFAIKQSVLQRVILTKPQLIVHNIEAEFSTISDDIFSCKPLDEVNNYNFSVKISNVGLGTALFLNYNWEFDYLKFIELCKIPRISHHPLVPPTKVLHSTNAVDGFYSDDEDSDDYLHFYFIKNRRYSPYSIPKVVSEIEYLMPINQSEALTEIRLPTLIPLLVLSHSINEKTITNMMLEDVSFGNLNIFYNDISGNKIRITYKTKVRLKRFQGQSEKGAVYTFIISFARHKKNTFLNNLLRKNKI